MKRRLHILILAAVTAMAAMTSCITDEAFPGPGGGNSSADESLVKLTISTPDPESDGVTRAAVFGSDRSNEVNDLLILVLEKSGSDYLYSYAAQGQRTAVDAVGGSASFEATLRATENPVKVVVLANHAIEVMGFDVMTALPAAGTSEANLRALLVAVGLPTGLVPMWGETTLPSLMPFDNTAINIEVMRAAARADISKRLNAGSRPFTVSSVAIYHANNRIQVMPNPSALDPGDPNRVVTASIPTYAEPMTTPVVFSVTDNNVDQTYAGAIYVPESLPAATAADRVDATCLVVGGAYTYADGTSKTLYYRVDFNSGAPGHPFGQVLRNTRYNFVITSVTAPGKETPDEAASSTDTSMTVAVTNWDENYSQVAFVSNVDYMMLDASHIVMPSTAGATKTFRLRLTTPLAPDLRYTMAAATYGDPPHNTIFISQYYTVSRDAGTLVGDYYEFVFTVTTNSANTDPLDMRPDEVVFTARGASLPITIVQDAFLADDPGKSRKINVLSLTGGEGSMGTYYPGGTANTAGTAANMRSILTNASYFGPGGIVDFPGFTFEQFSTTDISSATTVSTDQLRRALDVTDILIMPYGSDPNPTIVGIINQWRTDPRHVLFMSADAGLATGSDGTVGIATNVNMWNSLNDGLTWYPESVLRDSQGLLDLVVDLLSDVLTIVLNIVTTTTVQIDGATVSNPTTANSPFTGGAFGQPNMSQLGSDSGAYQLWDYTSEWAVPADGSSFQPLMVYQVTAVQKLIIGLIETGRTTTKSNMTLMGVDPTTRIVYFGETQLMTDFMGATPGANSNSTLMCNTWAWAVDTVLGR